MNLIFLLQVRPFKARGSAVMGYRMLPQPLFIPMVCIIALGMFSQCTFSPQQQFATRDHQQITCQPEELSSTNLYIRGLVEQCHDEDLVQLCSQ